MGIATEAIAGIEATYLEGVVRRGLESKNHDIIEFCHKELWQRYLNACEDSGILPCGELIHDLITAIGPHAPVIVHEYGGEG